MKTVLESGVSSLIESGMYPDKKALFDEALGVLLETKPQLKIEIALRLYRKGEISLSRAAEIAGVSIEGIKNMLSLHGMQRNVKTCTEKEYAAAEKFVRGRDLFPGPNAQVTASDSSVKTRGASYVQS